MISVIIPVFNEKAYLPKTLTYLKANQHPYEVLVVDGGSTDGSVELAQKKGLRVLESAVRQRATQMNLGARAAHGTSLLFLHADTLLCSDSLAKIASALNDEETVGGAFARRFDHPSFFLKVMCRLADFRGCLFGIYFGDQGLFVKTEAFHRLGGFREMGMCEDADFSRRLRQLGRTRLLTPSILSSGRRFENDGPIRRSLRDFWLLIRYWLKTSLYTQTKK